MREPSHVAMGIEENMLISGIKSIVAIAVITPADTSLGITISPE